MTVTPKQPNQHSKRHWYPYYASFRPAFVSELLENLSSKGDVIIDPWNGAGTTTTVASGLGRRAEGIDINPALTVIARARLTPPGLAESVTPLAVHLTKVATRKDETPIRHDDLLTRWMRPDAVRRLRALEHSIRCLLLAEPTDAASTAKERADTLSALPSFLYSALFLTARQLLKRFRASNPTWIRPPDKPSNRVAPGLSTINEVFVNSVELLGKRISKPGHLVGAAHVNTGDAKSLQHPTSSFDAAHTSPPYATRIDYVTNALVELAVLGAGDDEVVDLRQLSTGGPVVRGIKRQPQQALTSQYAVDLLAVIGGHDSKGSSNYYMPWMSNYFHSLQAGVKETARVVREEAPIAMVVQDSHYKNVHIDLQRVVIEVMEAFGRDLVQRDDFAAKNHLARINPAAREHLEERASSESVLVFR